MTEFEDKSVLVLSFTDQYSWGFSGSNGIFLNCSTDVDDAWYGSMTGVFRNVLRYDIFKGANRAGICEANREILTLAATYRPDYVLYPCNFSGIVTEGTLSALRQMGAIIIVSFFDDDVLFDWCRGMIPRADYIVTHLPQLLRQYQNEGARSFLMPTLPYNPARTRKLDNCVRKVDATFVGSLYSHRKQYIEEINRAGAPLVYLGGGTEQKLDHADMVRIINESRISLNFSSGRAGRIALVGRIFEVPLCGGFLLSEYIPGIERCFEVGKEIDCFSSPAEAADKIKFYLENASEREAMAARAYNRAQREYSSRTMLKELFASIEQDIGSNGRPSPGRRVVDTKSLHDFEAGEYYKWVEALLQTQGPLRAEWIETAKLVLATNPSHRGAIQLLRRADKWGDPRPLRRFIGLAEWRVRAGVDKGIERLKRTRLGGMVAVVRKKLRQAA